MSLAEAIFDDGAGNGHFDLLKIEVEPTDEVSPALPQRLNVIKRWREEDAVKTRPMVLGGPANANPAPAADDEGAPGGPAPVPINGKVMDMARIDEVITLDDIEIWEITNQTGRAHPFHVHDIQFLLLDRAGSPPPAHERGWKDTVLVPANDTVRIITQFTTYANDTVPYMYHCHIMEHEDNGMMGQFVVVEQSSVFNQSNGYWLPSDSLYCSLR